MACCKLVLIVIAFFGIICIIIGAVLGFAVLPDVIISTINENARLENGTVQFTRWKEMPFPITIKVYFFTIKNSDILKRVSAIEDIQRIEVEQIGPFIYRQSRYRDNVEYDEDKDTLLYFKNTFFEFDEKANTLSLDEMIYTLNVPLMNFFQMTEKLVEASPNLLDTINYDWMEAFPGMNLFQEFSANELLFDGIKFCPNGAIRTGEINPGRTSPMESITDDTTTLKTTTDETTTLETTTDETTTGVTTTLETTTDETTTLETTTDETTTDETTTLTTTTDVTTSLETTTDETTTLETTTDETTTDETTTLTTTTDVTTTLETTTDETTTLETTTDETTTLETTTDETTTDETTTLTTTTDVTTTLETTTDETTTLETTTDETTTDETTTLTTTTDVTTTLETTTDGTSTIETTTGTTIPDVIDSVCSKLNDMVASNNYMRIIDRDEDGLSFAFLRHRHNNSVESFLIKAGMNVVEDVGNLLKWRNDDILNMWNDGENSQVCKEVRGRDFLIFPPHATKEDTVDIFRSDICRVVSMKFEDNEEYKGIPGYRYEQKEDTFTNDGNQSCYCTRNTRDINGEDTCWPDGFMDLYTCLNTMFIMSNPHFLNAEESEFAQTVIGLEPKKEDHGSYVVFEPNTGTVLKAVRRTQFNMVLRPISFTVDSNYDIVGREINGENDGEDDGEDNGGNDESKEDRKVYIEATRNLPRAVMPIFWVEEEMELPYNYVRELRVRYFDQLVMVDVVTWVLIGFGILIFFIGLIFVFIC
ncbi:sensory neuron membrane protein 2-like [Onthophagus taurus]|uniref:sensory neuron membrane protein 2-like n=1 Tax=Onthophagus taurus TaxID=166361 RepID=UPI0039BE4A4C